MQRLHCTLRAAAAMTHRTHLLAGGLRLTCINVYLCLVTRTCAISRRANCISQRRNTNSGRVIFSVAPFTFHSTYEGSS